MNEGPEARLAQLGGALRAVQDRVAFTKAPGDVTAEATSLLERAAALLDPFAYDVDRDRSWSDIAASPGTRTFGPVLRDVETDGETLTASVLFTPFYLGANGAVHGGALPLMFDEALARLTNFEREQGRTAFLKVDYRNVTPVGRMLRVTGRIERIEGRKRFAAGALLDGDVVTAEATSLYVELQPGAD